MRWVLIAALLARLAILGLDVGHPDRLVNSDTATYLVIAQHLPDALWSSQPDLLKATLERPPGYPVLLAGAMSSVLIVVIFQIAISLVVIWLTYRISVALVGSQFALVSASVAAFDPITLSYDFIAVSETLFTLALLAAVAVWLIGIKQPSVGRFLLIGFIFGLTTLIRPVTLYIVLFLVPVAYLIGRSERRKSLLCVAIVFGFAILPGMWFGRNVALTGVPVFSTVEGYNLLHFRAAAALAFDRHITLTAAQAELEAQVAATGEAERAREETNLAINTLVQHPRGTVVQASRGLALMLLGPGRDEWNQLLGRSNFLLVALQEGIAVAILALATVGGYVAIRSRDPRAIAVLSIVIYFLAVSSGEDAYSRFRVPIVPLLALLAGVGSATLLRFWRSRSSA